MAAHPLDRHPVRLDLRLARLVPGRLLGLARHLPNHTTTHGSHHTSPLPPPPLEHAAAPLWRCACTQTYGFTGAQLDWKAFGAWDGSVGKEFVHFCGAGVAARPPTPTLTSLLHRHTVALASTGARARTPHPGRHRPYHEKRGRHHPPHHHHHQRHHHAHRYCVHAPAPAAARTPLPAPSSTARPPVVVVAAATTRQEAFLQGWVSKDWSGLGAPWSLHCSLAARRCSSRAVAAFALADVGPLPMRKRSIRVNLGSTTRTPTRTKSADTRQQNGVLRFQRHRSTPRAAHTEKWKTCGADTGGQRPPGSLCAGRSA